MTATLQPSPAHTGHGAERPLRIAMVAPPWYELPPIGYGGIESVVADLVNTLADRGHEITLIGSGRHRTKATRFIPIYDEPPSDRIGMPLPELTHVAGASRIIDDLDIDVIHDHSLAGPLLALHRDVPTVITMHGPVTGDFGDYYARLGDAIDIVAISDAQRRINPNLNWIDRVHNAIDVSSFPFQPRKEGYLLWLGRFNPDKGPQLAIDIAKAAGRRIVLAGKCAEPLERRFFAAEIEPRLGPGVDYVGEADGALKRQLFAAADALLFPIQWEEPFGMVMIEAMACGTPVVAMRRGSVPEVIEHGVSGMIVDDVDQAAEALRDIGELSPVACRHRARSRFDLPVMAAGYERVYRAMVASRQLVIELTDREPLRRPAAGPRLG